ncbi:MAG: Resolvase helix-turn-helix domain protein [Xanthobacteraceae bacterium]|nr:Resolvase helix-turn-helix domain protein [Xanthobacteraceae bacterium]
MLIGYCLLDLDGPTGGMVVPEAAPFASFDRASVAPQEGPAEVASSGKDALAALGCERVFTDFDDGRAERPGLRAALEFLRAGDVLVVPALRHLGRDVESVVLLMERLRLANVSIRLGAAPDDGRLAPSEALALVCRELAVLIEPEQPAPSGLTGPPRRRGRPQALSPKDVAKARRMLAGGGFTVPDVARTLGVSAATVYRYFPRRSQKQAPPEDVTP